MLKNYLITAYRNILKHKLYAAINILGLTVGLVSCIAIFLFVQDELSYDNWIPDADRIYRLHNASQLPGRAPLITVRAPGPARETFLQEFPEIEYATRMYRGRPIIRQDDRSFFEIVTYADESFFKVFDLPFVEGDKGTALTDNSALYLSERMAEKYFGDASPMGKILNLGGKKDYKIAGVFKDLPRNSHLELDFMARFELADYKDRTWVAEYWTSLNTFQYFKLKEGVGPESIIEGIPQLLATKVPPLKVGEAEFKAEEVMTLTLDNVQDIHLKSVGLGAIKPGGDIMVVYTFSAVAILILIIACINFMNLATARSLQRAREVGVRKVVGATRTQIAVQFLSETTLMTFVALLIALGVVEAALPSFNELVGKDLNFDYLGDPSLSLSLVGLVPIVGFIGGLYPALYLSSFRPSAVLKASPSSLSGGASRLRSGLVVLQFSISIALVICTAIVYGQTTFVRNLDLGFSKDNKLVLRGMGRAHTQAVGETMAREINNLAAVENVAFSLTVPSDQRENDSDVKILGQESNDAVILSRTDVDDQYFKTYDIPILAGRDFTIARGQDELIFDVTSAEPTARASVLLNASGARRIGFANPADAVGQIITIGTQDSKTGLRNEMEIIGIAPDVHFQSLKRNIRPFIYVFSDKRYNNLTIKYRPGSDLNALVQQVEKIWKNFFPGIPVNYDFLDENIAQQYDTDQNKGLLFAAFSSLAILIACMGLYGLSAFNAETRTKEIGIRKVMGATVMDIIKLLVWQFSKPVIIANILAWPVAFYVAQDYLNGFQYRIDIHPGYFIVASLTALFIAWATVIWHATKVAGAKPIKALRYE